MSPCTFLPPSICIHSNHVLRGPIKVESGWHGRNALGPKDVTAVYEKHVAQGGFVLHEKRTLTEDPFMEIFIAKDPDGYELCLITRMLMQALKILTSL